ncbi:MAG: sugar ABC transporter ATP-binding protein [Lachnospiraceae bacterium]|nr:sugar ABC transporter ATP-binding protein [Lachnospiraceae bacterium]
MGDKIIELKQVNKHYGGVHALKNADFDLERGEIHCLIGQNGCGKSTMIKVISGVIEVDPGSEVYIDGKRASGKSTKLSMDSGVRVIYQDLSLFPNLTVTENIAFDMYSDKKVKGVNWKKMRQIAEEVTERMGVSLNLDALAEELSIADRQLVAIARALATNARLIIMDEPTSSLTRKEVNALFAIIKSLQAKGITIMFVSHKLDEIIEIAERITVMRNGEIIKTIVNDNIDETKLAELISGQEITYHQDFVPHSDEEILRVENLSCGRQYQDVSFSLKKGEILGIIGLLGAGRTELASTIFGMNPADSGKIFLHGKEVSFKKNTDAIAHKIAYVPEDRLLQGLVLDQSIENNTIISVIDTLKTKLGLLDKKTSRDLTTKWIDELHIKSAVPDINASAMSGGNQQKIVISKWLSTKPDILILDQPTNGIDIGAKSTIYDLIRELSRQGMSIILISDEVPEIYYNCPRALVMHKGHIVQELDCSSISEKEFAQEVLNEQ